MNDAGVMCIASVNVIIHEQAIYTHAFRNKHHQHFICSLEMSVKEMILAYLSSTDSHSSHHSILFSTNNPKQSYSALFPSPSIFQSSLARLF